MATVLGKFLQTTLFLGAIFISIDSLLGEERTIPSFTAYSLPKSNGIAISERRGASKWQPENRLVWYGSSKGPSKLNVSIELQMQKGTTQNFRMSIGSQSRESTVSAEDDSTRRVTFGEFTIEKPGYHAFTLEALKPESMPGLVVNSMILEGLEAQLKKAGR